MKVTKLKTSRKMRGKVYGPGTIIASFTGVFGIAKCEGCEQREEEYNNKADRLAKALGLRKDSDANTGA